MRRFSQATKGISVKLLCTVLGLLLSQKQFQFFNRELVEKIRSPRLPILQWLPGYKDEELFVPSLLAEFRKRLAAEALE